MAVSTDYRITYTRQPVWAGCLIFRQKTNRQINKQKTQPNKNKQRNKYFFKSKNLLEANSLYNIWQRHGKTMLVGTLRFVQGLEGDIFLEDKAGEKKR